ncbi:hypothetical protein FOZ63_031090, partial [Perkinsus olseni]
GDATLERSLHNYANGKQVSTAGCTKPTFCGTSPSTVDSFAAFTLLNVVFDESMVHFVPTWLIAIQALFMTRAQEVGEYVHEAEDFKMTSRVNEDHQVVFSFSARPKPGFTPDRASIAFSMQTVPLSHIKGSTYSYNVGGANPPSSLTDLYTAIGRCFRTAGLDGSGSSFPPAGIQYGDLAFPIYRNDNSLTTYFRNKEILFMRVTRSWSPGKFVYRSPARPKVKLVYKEWSPSLPFQAVWTPWGAEDLQLGKLLTAVKRVCPGISLGADDLKKVVFVTDRTIYVRFEELV